MSDRLERSTRETAREVTPHADDLKLFAFLEDKWKDRAEGPRALELHLAFGPGGGTWRPDIIHQKEFKANGDPPSRPEIAELANTFTGAAQRHCDQLGRPQGFVVLAFHPAKGSHPYGVHFTKFRPTPGLAIDQPSVDEFGVTTDENQRQSMMSEHLAHVKESNEHVRFMSDSNHRYTGQVLALLMEQLREANAKNAVLESQRIEYFKALEEVNAKRHEREMEKEKHQLWMGLTNGGISLLTQMVPVFQKALEQRKGGAPAGELEAGEGIASTPESNAIKVFVKGLNDEQRGAIFGYIDKDSKAHVPGILSTHQTEILAGVGDLAMRRSALDNLLPGGPFAITGDQVMKLAGVVPMDQLLALRAVVLEGRQGHATHEPQQEATQ